MPGWAVESAKVGLAAHVIGAFAVDRQVEPVRFGLGVYAKRGDKRNHLHQHKL